MTDAQMTGIKMWLDDVRVPGSYGHINGIPDASWTWVKTADQAIELLKTGQVVECSLDHDLADEHYDWFIDHGDCDPDYQAQPYREKTGYDVVLWMAENNVWPPRIAVHSMNPAGSKAMLQVIRRWSPESLVVHGRI